MNNITDEGSDLHHDIVVVDQALLRLASLQEKLKRIEQRRIEAAVASVAAKYHNEEKLAKNHFLAKRSASDVANVGAYRNSHVKPIPRKSRSERNLNEKTFIEQLPKEISKHSNQQTTENVVATADMKYQSDQRRFKASDVANVIGSRSTNAKSIPRKGQNERNMDTKIFIERSTSPINANFKPSMIKKSMKNGLASNETNFINPDNSKLSLIQLIVLVEMFKEDPNRIHDSLEIISNLCSIDSERNNATSNRNEVFETGGHHIILATMNKHYTNQTIQEVSCRVLQYLMINKQIRNSLVENHVTLDTIALAIRNFPNSEKIHQFGFGVLNSVTWKNEMNTTTFVNDLNGPIYICSSMRAFPNNYVLQQFGALILVNMIRWHRFRNTVISSGGRELLTQIVVEYMDGSIPGNTSAKSGVKSKHAIDFESKICKKARRAVRRLL